MTREQRTIVIMALNQAKRAWLEAEGGYRKVEADAQGHELVLKRRANGTKTTGPQAAFKPFWKRSEARQLHAQGHGYKHIARRLGVSYSAVYFAVNGANERKRDADRRYQARRRAIANSQSTSDVS